MFGIGIVGCGAISRFHINSFREIEDVEIKAVSDVNMESAARTGEELKVDYYGNFEKILARNDIDAISICTPSGLHEDIAVKAAKAKKHIIVEKPIEVNLEKIDNMIAACRENGVKLACIFNNRYREGNAFLKKALEAGRLGRIINANAYVRWYREPDYYLKSNWRGTWALDGGGALMNQSIHYVDLIQWFAGEIESVCAYTGTLLHKSIQTEDTATAILKFKSGALGTIVAATSIYPGFPAEIQITGERGTVSVSDGSISTWSFRDKDEMDAEAALYINDKVDNRRASDPFAFDYTYHKKQLQQIICSFRKGIEPDVNGPEARKSVELILAIYEASAKNMEIKL